MPAITLYPIKDAYVSGLDTNNHNGSTLRIGPSYRAYFEFDFSSIPKDATLGDDIYLHLYSLSTGEMGGYDVNVCTSAWDETTIKNGNEPTSYREHHWLSSIYANVNSWSRANLWLAIKKQFDGRVKNYGLYVDGFENTVEYIEFASKEHSDASKKPYLTLSFSMPLPNVPSNLIPTGGIVLDRAKVQRLNWQHNPAKIGEAQTKFDLQWRVQGTTNWNIVSLNTANQYWDAPTNTFTHGMIEWQVRTYDQYSQASSYSAISLFYAGDKPSESVITTPTNGSLVSGPQLTVQWTSVGQTEYNLLLTDTNSNALWEETKVSIDKTKIIGFTLANNTSYKIRLRIKNVDGLWSDFAESSINVVYATVPPPTFTISQDNVRGSLKLDIVNDEVSIPKKVTVGLKGKTVADGTNPEKHVVNPVITSKDSTGQVISTVTVSCTLRECNGIKDEVTQDGKKIQRVGYKAITDNNLAWGVYKTGTGYKAVSAPNVLTGHIPLGKGTIVLKYNSKKLSYDGTANTSDSFIDYANGTLLIAIPSADSGWGDAYTPTVEEIKAYFMGWVMHENIAGFPPYNGTGAKVWSGINNLAGGTEVCPTTLVSPNFTPYRLYYQLVTPIETNITPIEINCVENGTVEVTSEVIPEYTLSAPLPVSYTNEIFRRKQGEINWLRLAKGLQGNTPYIDYTPQHQQQYEYKVRMILDTLAYADSNVTLASIELKNSQIALPSDYSKWVSLKFNPAKSQRIEYDRTLMRFAGREDPIAEFTKAKSHNVSNGFTVTRDTLEKLMEIADKRETVLYRDSRGKRVFGTIGAMDIEDDNIRGYYIVKFTVDKVGYIEGV